MFGRKKDAGQAGEGETDYAAQAREALRSVTDPAFRGDVVAAGFVKAVEIDDRSLKVRIELPTPSAPIAKAVREQAERALANLGWGLEVTVEMTVAAGAATTASSGPSIASIVAVASGKGGVGKSTVAVNLAFALKALGKRVGILDADIYGPSIPHMLGVAGRRPATSEVGGKTIMIPVEKDGVSMMSMGFLVEPDKAVIWRGPMVHGALKQFFTDVAWGELDVLVIDLPPGTGDAQLTMVQSVPVTGAVIVTTPQDVAMIDARKAYNMFRDTNVPVLGVVENMSLFSCPHCGEATAIFGQDGARRWAGQMGVPFLGAIPIALAVREHGDDGRPAVTAKDTPEAVKEVFAEVARRVAAGAAAAPASKPLEL